MASTQDPESQGGEVITGINITPFVDITLVLMIIFIVTAKVVVTPAVPLDIPKAAHTEQIQVIFSIILPRNKPTLVDGREIKDDTELLSRAREALATHPELHAVIQADGAVPHRRVLHTLDLMRQVGITHIAFAAQPEEKR